MTFFSYSNVMAYEESKYDVLSGKLMPGKDAQGLAHAYRMSFLYFLAPVLASVYSGVDWSNIVEHDTAQRLKQWSTLMLGDEEQVQEAFYGKGPLISTFGGPITSDILEIGMMLDLVDLVGLVGQGIIVEFTTSGTTMFSIFLSLVLTTLCIS